MKIICSSNGIIDPVRPNAGMMHITDAGFTDVLFDLGMYCKLDELDAGRYLKYRKKTFDVVPKGTWSIAKTPFLAHSTNRMEFNVDLPGMVEEGLRYSASLGCEYIIVQPFFLDIEKECLWDANKQYYLDLMKMAREVSENSRTIRILLQNLPKDVNGHMTRGICSDSVTTCQWIDQLNELAGEEFFGMCVDTGALNVCGQDMYEYIHTLGHRVKTVILRENDGQNNSAMLPFTSVARGQSQMDWLGVIRGLREVGFDGYLILEFGDTACAFSPLLRPQLLKLAKSVAEYFKWQIEIENLLKKHESIVLFGAGNMCRNYMKCYGEKYPPLFTCDNNKALWGSDFCGLEVKSPECLKDLPKDCAIFICNVYYREIEQQLRDMGIDNDIEFFNDEYMPTFYFDRIER